VKVTTNNLSVKSTEFFAASIPVYKIIELKNTRPTFAFYALQKARFGDSQSRPAFY